MTISFDVGILPNRPFTECVDLCIAAEALGYGGVWVADSQSVMRDAYALLAVAATRTDRIRLATGVTNALTRHLAVLACSCATLDEISGGRAVLGIGVGESSVKNIGLSPDRLVDLETKIRSLRALIQGQDAEFEGRTFHLSWPNCQVPIFMACSGPKSLRMGGRIADGILFQVGAEPSFVRYALDNIRLGAEQAGRKLDDIQLFMRVACAISDDRDRARQQVKGYAAVAAMTTFLTVPKDYFPDELWDDLALFKSKYDYYQHGSNLADHTDLLTDRILDGIAITESPEDAIARFQELADMGLNGFVWPAGMPDAMEYVRTFGERVIPYVT